ncbi:MAG: hypothetical protein WEB93_03095 [Sphingomonadales bacterium]
MSDEEAILETIVADRFAVDLTTSLPEFDTAGADAYAARDIVSDDRPLYALVQRRGIPRRDGVVGKLLGRPVGGLLCPRGEGLMMVRDRDSHGKRLVTVMDRPTGGRVAEAGGGFTPLGEGMLRTKILSPLLDTLEALGARGITHRGISLRNLYYRTPEHSEVVLSECCSAPPAYHQSAAHEPIERSLAIPAGRGEGDPGCDMFALGVLILSLITGTDAAANAAERPDVLRNRIRSGSFWAIAGQREGLGGLADLVRGLMEDNPTRRWGVAEVRGWLAGLSPRKTVGDMGWVLARPVVFRGRSFKDRRDLALALYEHPGEAFEVIHTEKFLHAIVNALTEGRPRDWLERALDTRVGSGAAETASSTGSISENMGLARIMAVMFPEAPLCYGRLKVCPDGVPAALAMAFADAGTKADSDSFADWNTLFEGGRFGMLLDLITKRSPGQTAAIVKLETLQRLVGRRQLGAGPERILYELNKSLPCQSPKVRDHHPMSLRGLMMALEDAAAQGDLGISLIDRHVAGFIARHEEAHEAGLQAIERSSDRPEAFMFETLKLFGAIQRKDYPYPMRKLAGGFATPLKRAVSELKSRTWRKQAETLVEQLLDKGNLARIAQELDLAALRNRDQQGFRSAQHQYARLSEVLRRLEQPFLPTDPHVRQTGARYMAYAAVACLMVVTTLTLMSMSGGV